MFNNMLARIRQTRTAVENHPISVELKARQHIAFTLLDPQVRIVKRSPTVQLAFGTAITGLLLVGNVTTAAILSGCWFGSRPLTHVAAAGVAGVGMVDRGIVDAIDRLQVLAAEPA